MGVDIHSGFSRAIGFSEERSTADSKTETIGNDTLFGQIASFMDNLHLPYAEVWDGIPYRNLLLMSKDKLRVAYGEVYEEVTEEEMGLVFKKG